MGSVGGGGRACLARDGRDEHGGLRTSSGRGSAASVRLRLRAGDGRAASLCWVASWAELGDDDARLPLSLAVYDLDLTSKRGGSGGVSRSRTMDHRDRCRRRCSGSASAYLALGGREMAKRGEDGWIYTVLLPCFPAPDAPVSPAWQTCHDGISPYVADRPQSRETCSGGRLPTHTHHTTLHFFHHPHRIVAAFALPQS